MPIHRTRSLLDGPTPLHYLARASGVLGIDLFVKRDDIGSFGVAGSKARKLNRVINQAMLEGVDVIVMSGPGISNSCRALAAAGAQYGVEVRLLLYGEQSEGMAGNAALGRIFGATINWTGLRSIASVNAMATELVETLQREGRQVLLLPPGCSTPLGVLAMYDAHVELMEQCALIGVEPAKVYHASATGGIWAGLDLGWRMHGGAMPIPVMVADGIYPNMAAHYHRLSESATKALRLTKELQTSVLSLDYSQLGEGYGIATVECLEAIDLMARSEGVLLDPCYTGKAMAALVSDVRHGRLKSEAVVLWHSGGMQGYTDPEMLRVVATGDRYK